MYPIGAISSGNDVLLFIITINCNNFAHPNYFDRRKLCSSLESNICILDFLQWDIQKRHEDMLSCPKSNFSRTLLSPTPSVNLFAPVDGVPVDEICNN